MIDDYATDGFWNKEEFEDLVSRSLIACYEDKFITESIRYEGGHKMVLPKFRIPRQYDLNLLRAIGPYFTPDDRCIIENQYWHDIDGIPGRASWAFRRPESIIGHDDPGRSSYLEIITMEKIHQWPRGCVMMPGPYVAKYRVVYWYPKDKGLEAYAIYSGIRPNGKVVEDHTTESRQNGLIDSATTLQYYADRRHLWNVTAMEKEAKATFGVHKEQIKSLFYSRDLPRTATGRRRPILHWVAAHRRRMKEGADIEIEQYLRGIIEFEMDGTRFAITRPVKKQRHQL